MTADRYNDDYWFSREEDSVEDSQPVAPTLAPVPVAGDDDSDAFEKLEAGSAINGLIVPIQYTNPTTGEVVDLWGSIDDRGLFDIIDERGKTHPLMHPKALEACLSIAINWKWLNRSQAQQIIASHMQLVQQLHTPQVTKMMDGSKIAQVMTGYAELAKRYKVGTYGALEMDSQGDFERYVDTRDIADIMGSSAIKEPDLLNEVTDIIGTNKEMINMLAGGPSVGRSSTPTKADQPAPREPLPISQTEPPSHNQRSTNQPAQKGSETQTSVFNRYQESFGPNPSTNDSTNNGNTSNNEDLTSRRDWGNSNGRGL